MNDPSILYSLFRRTKISATTFFLEELGRVLPMAKVMGFARASAFPLLGCRGNGTHQYLQREDLFSTEAGISENFGQITWNVHGFHARGTPNRGYMFQEHVYHPRGPFSL